jgi:solute carrier family 29 (equilibrative nucleoside transporter), member 1/2/3
MPDAHALVSHDGAIVFRVFGRLPVTLTTVKYATFLLAGVASLWPWNCFLSASDYFQDRFASSPKLADNYSSTMMTVSTLTSTLFNYHLSRTQKGVNYAWLLKLGNYMQMAIFAVMAISVFLPQSWIVFYFVFVMANVMFTSIGTSLTQVGMMAMVNVQSPIYANATVVGNAIAGVLPSIAMIVAVVSNPMISLSKTKDITTTSTSTTSTANVDRTKDAVEYFITSVIIAALAQIGIFLMEYYEKRVYVPSAALFIDDEDNNEIDDTIDTVDATVSESDEHLELRLEEITKIDDEFISFSQLWSKLKYVESTIIIDFAVTLVFPVFASSIESTNNISKKLFVPLAFLIWNVGDLIGRVLCAFPTFIVKRNSTLIIYAIARVAFIPLFLLCNIKNRGDSSIGDSGYLLIQLLFGISNGQLFSSSYMCVGELLDTGVERKAAAAFTALLINLSLLAGSLGSFLVVYFCL